MPTDRAKSPLCVSIPATCRPRSGDRCLVGWRERTDGLPPVGCRDRDGSRKSRMERHPRRTAGSWSCWSRRALVPRSAVAERGFPV